MTLTRIQRKRTKGWRMPPNTVYVGRGSVFGNPFTSAGRVCAGWSEPMATMLVDMFKEWLAGSDRQWAGAASYHARANMLAALPRLGGKNLACWCPLHQPCHADVLLEIANR